MAVPFTALPERLSHSEISWPAGAAARIAVDVLTVVVAAMAGATTNLHFLLFSSIFSKTQYSTDVVHKAGFLVVTY